MTKLYSILIALAGAAACVDSNDAATAGNDALGIARYETTENETTTRIVGLDANGGEVSRVTLTHGGFELTSIFKDDYPGLTNVVGRKLEITIGGEPRLLWETADFSPTLHMPIEGHNPELVALLADPQVRDPLARWNVGFNVDASTDESAYSVIYSAAPNFQTECANSATCGPTVRGFTVNTCGAGGNPSSARRFNGNSNQVDEVLQCCPAGTGGNGYNWAARKLCPNAGTATDCGTANAACKGCAVVPQGTSCAVCVTNLPSLQEGFLCYDGGQPATQPINGQCCSGFGPIGGWCCAPQDTYLNYPECYYPGSSDPCAQAAGCNPPWY